ncbi:MAG: hypothetical protein LBP35_03620 [Candidatus Ancillula trichonymphae]|nr:hypothetical protein [Candidatus Ancillula trichonymphae]
MYFLFLHIGTSTSISHAPLPQHISTTATSATSGASSTSATEAPTRIANDIYKILLTKYGVSNLKDVATSFALSREVASVLSTIYSFADRADGDVNVKVSLKSSETTREVLTNAAAVIYTDAKPSLHRR